MSGRSYTIKEMKTIVDYLTENKLYGEIRGRKMWVDLATSKLTPRTWQSLKETFLKRILPDIHNPYYKLTIEQINSFRAGYDISDKNKNKLEIHTISDDSNSNGATQNDKAQSNNDDNIKEEVLAGEVQKCTPILSRNRSSADTVIVETCYETAEDIQKDLESPRPEARENGENKSLRDCITYSEPLTPMLQEVLDDFQSEPENDLDGSDRENQLEIVSSEPVTNSEENVAQKDKKNEKPNNVNSEENVAPTVEEVQKTAATLSKDNSNKKAANTDNANKKVADTDNSNKNVATADNSNKKVANKDNSDKKDANTNNSNKKVANGDNSNKKVSNNDKKSNDVVEDNGKEDSTVKTTNSNVEASENCDVTEEKDTDDVIKVPSSSENSVSVVATGNLNYSNSTPDASLPNNPEALNKKQSIENTSAETNIKNKSRKRCNSEHVTQVTENKKSRLVTKKSKATSETESKKTKTTVALSKSKQKETPMEADNSSNNKDEEKSPNIVTENLASVLEKPSTSLTADIDKVLLTSDSDQTVKIIESAEIKNPCLENVSLFEEQFNKLKYKSESSDLEQKKSENTKDKDKTLQEKKLQKDDMVVLKSHTDSESDEIQSPSKKQRARAASKKEREKALANVFGFSSGGSNLKHKKQLSHLRRTISQSNITQHKGDSDTSEWTSESESEHFVSPPRGRRNRQAKKYLKPQSGRILSLEEEGGLFVMYGKKIYPLIKDGKLVKNYLTYLPDSESEEENYWKLKYVEEKKKAAQLKKLLEKSKGPDTRKSSTTTEQSNSTRNSVCNHNPPAQEGSSTAGKEVCVMDEEKKVETKSHPPESIKIKFTTKNDQEIHLEGNWPQIHNVLEHVVHIFHKEPQPVSQGPKTIVEPPPSSGISTPVIITAVQEPNVDPVHEKVNKIESEIFKEIEERDKEEPEVPPADKNAQEANVTKRRPVRTRNSSLSSVPQSPAKRQKVSDQQDSKETENKTESPKEVANENGVTKEANKRPSRTPRKVLNDSLNISKTRTMPARRSRSKLNTSNISNEDEEIRYKLSPEFMRELIKASTSKNTKVKPLKSTTEAPKIFSSPETECPNTMESTQGYQDTDPSPAKNNIRKKKYMNVSVLKSKAKSHLRRSSRLKPLPRLYIDGPNVSCLGSSIQKVERDNSTLNTDVYRTESYQLLMPKVKNSSKQLEQIDETASIDDDEDFIKQLDSNTNSELFSVQVDNCLNPNYDQINNDVGSSSNISLPLSPELSVVENLSISKDLINDLEDGRTLNEMQCNVLQLPTDCSQYLMSQIDVSVPLMQQNCGFEINTIPTNIDEPKIHLTESLLSKIGTFSIKDQTDVTGNLDLKLRDLLLESAKKITVQDENGENKMEIDTTSDEVQKRSKNKKRCSTPRKRKDSLKSKKNPKLQPVIVEEHMETYSHGGRYSCPPIIQTVSPVETDTNLDFNIADLTINENVKSKGRKKKDVIKVKILRPKHKKSLNTTKTVTEISKVSICNDSGINDPEPGLYVPADESVDLIHNHSETCLHTNECVGDSVEFIDNSVKSIVSLGDSMQSCDNSWHSQCELIESRDISPDFFCNNAQDDRSFYKTVPEDLGNIESTIETEFHSPIGTEASSLMTEDLSDDIPQPETLPNKWYLLSEDETTNTNITNAQAPVSSYGANLKQIFPIVCAVPDLSTISEISRENETNSRKPTLESLPGDNLVSSNNFDSKFSV